MKTLIAGIIIFWNSILFSIGRAIGMVIGGFLAGITAAIKDLTEMQKHLKYTAHMAQKQMEERRKNDGE